VLDRPRFGLALLANAASAVTTPLNMAVRLRITSNLRIYFWPICSKKLRTRLIGEQIY
jgi:hypothetical protein